MGSAVRRLTCVPHAPLCVPVPSGGNTEMRGWDWEAVLAGRVTGCDAALFTVTNPPLPGSLSIVELSETNALSWNATDGLLYSAAGDGNAYAWDLTKGVTVRSFSGHTKYLHSLAVAPRSRSLVTGSEDGTMKLWGACSCGGVFCGCGGVFTFGGLRCSC